MPETAGDHNAITQEEGNDGEIMTAPPDIVVVANLDAVPEAAASDHNVTTQGEGQDGVLESEVVHPEAMQEGSQSGAKGNHIFPSENELVETSGTNCESAGGASTGMTHKISSKTAR